MVMVGLAHGTWWDRTKDLPLEQLMEGRFTRLFADLPAARFDAGDLMKLAEAMTAKRERKPTPETQTDPEENPAIKAVYTYFGQFVDHDITLDPTSHLREGLTAKQLQALVDFRTPRLDLDNLYGRGPDDQPYMYEPDGLHMLLGDAMSGNPFDPDARQVLRGPNGRALIGDPRDDENRIIAQLQAAFIRFHNAVADALLRADPGTTFQTVRDQVRWHYQWVVVNDFLKTIMDKSTYDSVFPDPYAPTVTIPKLGGGIDLMPVEFSVAAYRFGHSMIRPQYRLNTTIQRRPIFSDDEDDAADLGGFRPIPADWAIDWQFFTDLEHGGKPVAGDPLFDPIKRKPQQAYKIDTSLVSPLRHLPARVASNPSILALRNLERGSLFELPSGQAIATALSIEPVPDEELLIGKATADDPKTPIVKIASGFADNCPLWTYVLAEAQRDSWAKDPNNPNKDAIPIQLGRVGSRLIGEVFAALLIGDASSYLHTMPRFVPNEAFSHGEENGAFTFGLAELITVALRPQG
jgi:Animal haem peroxidase